MLLDREYCDGQSRLYILTWQASCEEYDVKRWNWYTLSSGKYDGWKRFLDGVLYRFLSLRGTAVTVSRKLYRKAL